MSFRRVVLRSWSPIFILLVFPVILLAQKQEVIFNTLSDDLGEIKEHQGPAENLFFFTNNSPYQVRIQEIQASCGCLEAGYTEGNIESGDSGFVRIAFDPLNRPGSFKKYLDVKFNIPDFNQTLEISGLVYPGSMDKRDDFGYSAGSLKFKKRAINFGFVLDSEDAMKRVEVFNSGDVPVTLMSTNRSRSYVRFQEMVIPSKSFVEVPIYFGTGDLGYYTDYIQFETSEGQRLNWEVRATVIKQLEEFELQNPPEIRFSRIEYEFGKKKSGQVLSATFEIYNYGKSDLVIHKIQANCDCLSYNLSDYIIAPGRTAFLYVDFSPTIEEGWQAKHLNLYTNDPTQLSRRLTVNTKVY